MGLRTGGSPIKPKPFCVSYIETGEGLNRVAVNGKGYTLDEAIEDFNRNIETQIRSRDSIKESLQRLLPKG